MQRKFIKTLLFVFMLMLLSACTKPVQTDQTQEFCDYQYANGEDATYWKGECVIKQDYDFNGTNQNVTIDCNTSTLLLHLTFESSNMTYLGNTYATAKAGYYEKQGCIIISTME